MTMTTCTMTARERWLAALELQPVDRLPFWPKLDGGYLQCRKPSTLEDLHRWIGSDRHEGIPVCFREVLQGVSRNCETAGGTRRTTYCAGSDKLEAVDTYDPTTTSWHPTQFPIRSRNDVKIMAAYWRGVSAEICPEQLQKARERNDALGEAALRVDYLGESPLMYFVEWLAGVEMAHFLLADCPEEVEELFDALQQLMLRKSHLTAEAGLADATYFVENTSSTLISPTQYRRYCLPHLKACVSVLRQRGKRVILHMCGHLKLLLPDIRQVGANAFEAFTSPTVGNTRLLDGRTACPDTCLIGGTNATLWLKPSSAIIAELDRDLAALPHHRGLVITSGGVMPPLCEPETIRAVAEWVKGRSIH